jgi:hypothetical protein
MGVYTTKLIGAAAVGVIVYVSSIVQGASQTTDTVAIPKTSWEKLESAISGVAEALRAIRPAQASTQSVQTTSPPASATANQVLQDSELPASTAQVYLEGKWVTEWPWEAVTIASTHVEDPRYPGGKLSTEFDGTYRLTTEHHSACYYDIALSPDHNKMFWVPTNKKVLTNAAVSVLGCRPATIFYRIRNGEAPRDRDCCVERLRERDCCGERRRQVDCCVERHREGDCCGERRRQVDCCVERHREGDCCGERRRHVDCCVERHREADCCGERYREGDCCGERHRERDCCVERQQHRDCCFESRKREPLAWQHAPPCDYCRPWEWADPF